MNKQLECSQCGNVIAPKPDVAIGYAIRNAGNLVCYDCCAREAEEFMQKHGQIALYLVLTHGAKREVMNWPGSLRFPVRHYKEGKHNMARIRRDVWFDFKGYQWHGVQYGEFSELCYCRKTKRKLKVH